MILYNNTIRTLLILSFSFKEERKLQEKENTYGDS